MCIESIYIVGLLFVMLHLCTYCYDYAARFISQVVVFIGIYILLLLFTVTLMLLNDLLAVQIGVWDQFRCRFFIHWFVKKIAVLFDDVYIWNAFDVVCWTWSKLIIFFMLCKMGGWKFDFGLQLYFELELGIAAMPSPLNEFMVKKSILRQRFILTNSFNMISMYFDLRVQIFNEIFAFYNKIITQIWFSRLFQNCSLLKRQYPWNVKWDVQTTTKLAEIFFKLFSVKIKKRIFLSHSKFIDQ